LTATEKYVLGILGRIPGINLADESLEDKFERLKGDWNFFEAGLGLPRTDFQRANPNTLMLRALTAELYHQDALRDRDFKQQTLKYAFGDNLDLFAANKLVFRQGWKFATATLRYYASAVLAKAIPIQPKTRARTEDNIVFYTMAYAEIPAGAEYVDVQAAAVRPVEPGDKVALEIAGEFFTADGIGAAANGIPAGGVHLFVDRPAFVRAVENTGPTGGGDDAQSDLRLKDDYIHEWTRYTTTGARPAYEYHVRSTQSNIGTVRAVGPNDNHGNPTGVPAGEVLVLFLMEDGRDPDAGLIERVREKLMGDPIHTMGDLVTVRAPTPTLYSIDFGYTVHQRDANRQGEIDNAVRAAAQEYIELQREIGACINPDLLRHLVMRAGAHTVPITNPAAQVIPTDHVAKLAGEPAINFLGVHGG